MSVGSLARKLRDRIAAGGPIGVEDWIESCLYDPDHGFYITGGRAGRRGDFITAPEVGPLFGAVVARALDTWWRQAGSPESFPVVEVGAGPGTLARAVLRAEADVVTSGALSWWAVEISEPQRRMHPEHRQLRSTASFDEAIGQAGAVMSEVGVVLANELLDNLPFSVLERVGEGWMEVAVGLSADGAEFETSMRTPDPIAEAEALRLVPEASQGQRIPWQATARSWLESALAAAPGGRVVLIDYGADTDELAGRDGRWMRTHADHTDDHDWLVAPGTIDITSDVAFDQLQIDHPAQSITRQADFLRLHGIDQLVDEGRRVWNERAHIGDLRAIEARSRLREAEALCDQHGMGSFIVAEWHS